VVGGSPARELFVLAGRALALWEMSAVTGRNHGTVLGWSCHERMAGNVDDHLLGFIGPKVEAEAIRDQLARFAREDLALELCQDRTLVTHARTWAARTSAMESRSGTATSDLADGGPVRDLMTHCGTTGRFRRPTST
jgi:hypothetical protein